MPLESTFSYSNAPQAIIPKKKYRNEDEGAFTLMSDPRVVRGAASKRASTTANRTTPGRSKAAAKDEAGSESQHRSHQPTYEYKVPVLVRPEIDLSQYLVEREPEVAGKKPRPPKAAETQTDEFQERLDTPEYVPRKTGVDVETQVEDVRDLFNFDDEVEPMLAVLCAKTIEQALFELSCEGELVNLQQQCDECEASRVREQQWVLGREQQTLAESCTKDLALKALKSEMARQREVREKVAGLEAMRQMLPALLEDVCGELYADGQWRDPERQDIDEVFLPGVYAAARSQLDMYKEAQSVVDELLLLAFEGKQAGPAECCGGTHNSKAVLKLMASGALCAAGGVGGGDAAESVTLGFVSIDDTDCVDSIDKKVNAKLVEEGLSLPQEVSVHGFLALALGHASADDLSRAEIIDHTKLPRVLNIVLADP